jgi:hypothetical protein
MERLKVGDRQSGTTVTRFHQERLWLHHISNRGEKNKSVVCALDLGSGPVVLRIALVWCWTKIPVRHIAVDTKSGCRH